MTMKFCCWCEDSNLSSGLHVFRSRSWVRGKNAVRLVLVYGRIPQFPLDEGGVSSRVTLDEINPALP